jgi:hypothetical protein
MRSLLVVMLFAAGSARAGYEDSGFSARAVSMGGAFTAVYDDIAAMAFNPAATGQLRHVQVQSNYLRQFHIPAGETDQNQMSLAAGFPVQQELIKGTFGLGWQYNRRQEQVIERSFLMNFGSRGFREFEGGGLELGGTVKAIGVRPKGDVDVGALYRFWEKYSLGLSILNLNRPKLERGRAPATLKLGLAESVRGFTLAMDATKREPSGIHGASSSLGAGLEHWWATARQGSLALRTGLVLGEPAKTWNWGLGWRILGGQMDYAMTVPMSGGSRFGHAVSLLFRFGESNPEGEYERMLAEEIRYRKELTASLEAGEVKQWKLSEELGRLREEIDVLSGQLVDKTASESQAQERIKALQERHQKASQTFEKLQSDRKKLSERTKETLFKEDWAAYAKLKAGAAPNAVLLENVKRLLREYKGSGVDLSQANQELLRLLRAQ